MKMWLLKHKMLLYFFAIFGAILVITDMLSWIGFLFQNLYKIPVDDRKVSLLGDITGGVIGGGGTMLAVILSIHRECKIVCVNRYCMNLLYAPYWGKQR